jgi:hypothetical protein
VALLLSLKKRGAKVATGAKVDIIKVYNLSYFNLSISAY